MKSLVLLASLALGINAAPALAHGLPHTLPLKEVRTKIANKKAIAYSLSGKILYTFEVDVPGHGSKCIGVCAEVWPPVLLTEVEAMRLSSQNGEVEIEDLNGRGFPQRGFGFENRGTTSKPQYQLTYNGYPLYYFAFDRSENDSHGDEHNPGGIRGWYAFLTTFTKH